MLEDDCQKVLRIGEKGELPQLNGRSISVYPAENPRDIREIRENRSDSIPASRKDRSAVGAGRARAPPDDDHLARRNSAPFGF